jgi:MraZ protein
MGNFGGIVVNFIGSYDYSVDAKGRLNVPAKFRKAVSPEAQDTFVIELGTEKHLRVYPKDVWDERHAKLSALPGTPEHVNYMRWLSSTSSVSALDAQGRIMLTPAQMKYSGIGKEVTIIGMPGYMELCDTARHREFVASEQDVDAMVYEIEKKLAGQ